MSDEPHVWNDSPNHEGMSGRTHEARLAEVRARLANDTDGDSLLSSQLLVWILYRMDTAEQAVLALVMPTVRAEMRVQDVSEMACLLYKVQALEAAKDAADAERITWLKHLNSMNKRTDQLQYALDCLNARMAKEQAAWLAK